MDKLALTLPGGQSVRPVAGMPDGNGFFQNALTFGLTTLLIVVTLAALIFFVWGGIAWITSQGDKGKIEAARKRIVFSIIGLIVAFSSFFIIRATGSFFGVNPLNIASPPGRYCNDPSDCGRPSRWECVNKRCRER